MPHNKSNPVFRLPDGARETTLKDKRTGLSRLWYMYRLRLRRRRFILRAIRSRRALRPISDRTGAITANAHLAFATVRNERGRLPAFLDHHRALGVAHFLIVVNDSTDGTADYLSTQSDVSVWSTKVGYKAARFGMDWINWLLFRYGSGHWCLTLDADELLVYPGSDEHPLPWLTQQLDRAEQVSFGALMLDMFPKGSIGAATDIETDAPIDLLPYFEAENYRATYRHDFENLWVQGGIRDRAFFSNAPERAPTMSKTPLVRWSRRYAYVSSTHTLLPRKLNHVYAEAGQDRATGALLHTKFLPGIVEKSREERGRGQHFANDTVYQDYYEKLIDGPDLWHEGAARYDGPSQLVELGLMTPLPGSQD